MKISVVIPLYNKKDTILRALQSVLSQTVMPQEIIVVNDGSTDDSEQVVAVLKHRLIKLVNQSNQGVSSARNRGIDEANYEWIAFLDADDEWLPDFLKTISFLSEKYPKCSVLATSYLIYDQNGISKEPIIKRLPFFGEDGILNNYFEVAAHSNPPFCSGSVVVRKESLLKLSGFPINIHSGEDLVTWARLACISDIAYSIKECSVYYLSSPGSIDRRTGGPTRPDLVTKILKELKNNCTNHQVKHIKQYTSRWHKMRASILLRLTDNKVDTFNEIIKSIAASPWQWRIYLYLFLLFMPRRLVNKVFKK